jgi:hypothetical protein
MRLGRSVTAADPELSLLTDPCRTRIARCELQVMAYGEPGQCARRRPLLLVLWQAVDAGCVLRATEIEEVLLKALKWLEISGLS